MVFRSQGWCAPGSVLSMLLLIIVLEAISRRFRSGLPLELPYADDLALVAERKEDLLGNIQTWKTRQGLKVISIKRRSCTACGVLRELVTLERTPPEYAGQELEAIRSFAFLR